MRIKDSPKSNAEGGNKKEGKKKNNKQKTATNVTNKKEKTARQPKEKNSQKRSPSKDAAKVNHRGDIKYVIQSLNDSCINRQHTILIITTKKKIYGTK